MTKNKLLIYWEPFAISAEVFDDQGMVTQSQSLLINGEKPASEIFRELLEPMSLKGVTESALLLRQPQVKLNQITLPFLNSKEKSSFIKRRVQKEWDSVEDYYYSYSDLVLPDGKKDSVLTYTIGSEFIDEFIKVSRANNVLPLRAYSTQALALRKASLVTLPSENNIVIIDDDDTLLLVMVNEGKPVLLREMPYTAFMDRKEEFERLSKEIQRTWLYGKQQFKFFPNQVIFLGEELFEHRDTLCSLLDEVSYKVETKQYWKKDLFSSSFSQKFNFIPLKIQEVHATLKRALIVTFISIFVFASCLVWTLYEYGIEISLQDYITSENIVQRTVEVENEIAKKEETAKEIQQNQDQYQLVEKFTNKPIPAWLLIYFSEHIPDNLVLTETKMVRDSLPGIWHIDIFGKSPRDPIQSAQLLREFEGSTIADFRRLNLNIQWEVSWLANLKNGHYLDPDDLNKPFHLKGILQE